MREKKIGYCPYCDKHGMLVWIVIEEDIVVRGETFCIEQRVCLCEACGKRIGYSSAEDENLKRAYDAYRKAHSLLYPEEIKSIYSDFGLSQDSFGILLGLGAASIKRYECGGLQTKQIDDAIRSASKPENLIALLEANQAEIPRSQYEKAVALARSLST